MASITGFTPSTLPILLTPTQEQLLARLGEIEITTHGIGVKMGTSSIVKYEPLLQTSNLTATDAYWVYKSVITCYELKPKKYELSIKITDDNQQNYPLTTPEQSEQIKAIWDERMHEKFYQYLMRPVNFVKHPEESFKEKMQIWMTEYYGVNPELVKVEEITINPADPSSISPPQPKQRILGKQTARQLPPDPRIATPRLNPERDKKEFKTSKESKTS